MSDKRLRIPDEDVRLDADEIAVTQTRTFQRLFNLKQLGLAYLVYPAASHTRGAHSIQCLNEADKILKAIGTNNNEEAKTVRMAALLHDIGHVPFSHTLEDENTVLKKHDRPERIKTVLDLLKKELSPASTAIVDAATPVLLALSGGKDGEQDWKSDIVGNTVCADLLAYITTDAKWTGIEKRPGYYRIYEYFVREGNRLCIKLTKAGLRTDIVSAIMDLLDMRYALTERVFFHHAKCVASAMLARAARLCGLSESPELMQMGDERFFDYLNDLVLRGNPPHAKQLLAGLLSRRLYKRIFKVGRKNRDAWDDGRQPGAFSSKWRNAEDVESLLCSVEDTHGLPRGSLALWCPEGKAGMKLARAHVVWESANRTHGPFELRGQEVEGQFPGVHSRVKIIEDQYLDLWTFWIVIDPKFVERAAGVVRCLEDRIGLDCDPVFKETYLQRLPGFKESVSCGKAVAETLQKLQPQIEQALAGQAARDGVPHYDEATVLAATRAVAEDRMKPNSAKNLDNQPDLFSARAKEEVNPPVGEVKK